MPVHQRPPRPTVMRGVEWGDWPCLVIHDKHLSIGWQNRPQRKGGPCYLVGRASAIGEAKVVERFAFTDDGWAGAWWYLLRNDDSLAERLNELLTARVAADRTCAEMARLDAQARMSLHGVHFFGGYAAQADLRIGQLYDLRFFDDRLTVTVCRQVRPLVELPYASIDALEVGGPGVVSSMTRRDQARMRFFLGGIGDALAYADTMIQTFVRVRAPACELHLLCTTLKPDALRAALSRALGASDDAHAAAAVAVTPAADGIAATLTELRWLLSLRDSRRLSPEDFDKLRAWFRGDR